MNLQAIKYMAALAQYQHFGKAAQACFVSQPTLSMQIKKLEDELGVQLLERTNKSVMLTAIGATLCQHAETILQEISHMYDAAKVAKNPYGGEIKIGIIPTLAPYFLPLAVPKWQAAFPNLTYYLREEKTTQLLEKLSQGKLDAAILALPVNNGDFAMSSLGEEEFLLAVPTSHLLAKRKTIKEADLQQESLLLLEDGHCLREQALAICHTTKSVEIRDFRATSLETLRHMVAAGVGITLMPKLAARNNDNVCYIRFSGKKPTRKLGFLWRKTTPKAALLRDIADHAKAVFGKPSTPESYLRLNSVNHHR